MKNLRTHFRWIATLLATALLFGCNSESEDEEVPNEPTPGSGSSTGSPPSIWGDPDTSVIAGTQYVFAPEADDPDGDVLTFEIANQPPWADFDESSGTLQGVPDEEAVGTHTDIVISVSDDVSVVSLPGFSITVNQATTPDEPPGDGDSSSPPSITGQPNSSVIVNTTYSFQPQASDPDGDTLSFSIVNKPTWATLNTVTGRLSGTPDGNDIGTTSGIELSVTDGDFIDSLQPFSITVEPVATGSALISWNPPTLNDDGTPLQDLSGYRLYYGTVSAQYTETVAINSPGVSSYLLDDITTGTYFLVMTSVNSAGIESVYSGELTFEVGD